MKITKTVISICLIFSLVFGTVLQVRAEKADGYNAADKVQSMSFDFDVKSAYLMEATTGEMLFSKNETETADIASVTKVMTLLLVMEALEAGSFKLDDVVMISSNAASMGGSQVFLEEGERITVEELIKCAVIASANDASVALAELVSGTEEAFVRKMNEKAGQLNLVNTYFENTTGLDDTTTNHHSCAYDIAVLSRELVKYPLILKYSSRWQDSIRGGEMVLTNTNRLIRYYDGCNGLKTGSTDKAGFCITTTAKRGNMQLIAVILGAKTKDERNAAARALLDFGFANFALYESREAYLENIPVLKGKSDTVGAYFKDFYCVVEKSRLSSVEKIYDIPENVTAPVKQGDTVGSITYLLDGVELGRSEIYVCETVSEINLFEVIVRILSKIIVGK